jgi:hypothetical protein
MRGGHPVTKHSRELSRDFSKLSKSYAWGPQIPSSISESYDPVSNIVFCTLNFMKDIEKRREIRREEFRVRIKPGYPVWDTTSVVFIGLRYLHFR